MSPAAQPQSAVAGSMNAVAGVKELSVAKRHEWMAFLHRLWSSIRAKSVTVQLASIVPLANRPISLLYSAPPAMDLLSLHVLVRRPA